MKTNTAEQAQARLDKARARLHIELQVKVAERAEKEIKGFAENVKRFSFIMDLDSLPELDLEKLLAAPRFDFAHDVCGIVRHMDRTTYPGKLKDCFWPRCCRSGATA